MSASSPPSNKKGTDTHRLTQIFVRVNLCPSFTGDAPLRLCTFASNYFLRRNL